MNCKEGDLAIVVRAQGVAAHLLGRLITVKKITSGMQIGVYWTYEPAMYVGYEIVTKIHDSALRPIRDNPGKDETLTWCPRKESVPA